MAGIPIDIILGSLPEDLKPKGLEKLPQLITNQGIKIDTLIQPSINKILSTLPTENVCLTPPQTSLILNTRNNIVESLNKVGTNLNNLTTSLTGVQNFLILSSSLLNILKNSKTLLSLANKFTPIIPGAVSSALSDLGDFIRDTTFDDKGNSKLQPVSDTLNSAAISVAVVNSYITLAVNTLNLIDKYLTQCSNDSNGLIPLNPTIEGIVTITQESEQTLNQTTYKDFVLKIEEVPYTPTVTRRKAIALNKYGITIISTPLSFTTNPQILINELKFIIDKDNLKAY